MTSSLLSLLLWQNVEINDDIHKYVEWICWKKRKQRKWKSNFMRKHQHIDATFTFDSTSRNCRDFEYCNYIITLLFIELQRFKLIFAKQNVNYRLSHCDIVILKFWSIVVDAKNRSFKEETIVKKRSESNKRYDVANLIVDFVLIYSNFVSFSFDFLNN